MSATLTHHVEKGLQSHAMMLEQKNWLVISPGSEVMNGRQKLVFVSSSSIPIPQRCLCESYFVFWCRVEEIKDACEIKINSM